MYAKLIIRNLMRSTKEYAIYMMTLILIVTLMYAFNGVSLSSEVASLANNMSAFSVVTIFSSVLVIFVLAWLIYYISKYILEKRSREFGMYMLMGMTRKQVARMFLLEQVSMGLIAFVIGCVLGTIVYEVIQSIIFNLFSQDFVFKISFSFHASGLTLLYFVLMFLLELFREHRYLKKKSIHSLLYSSQKADTHKPQKKRSILFLIVGVLLYFVGLKVLDMSLNYTIDAGLGMIGCILCTACSIIFIYLGLSNVIMTFINRKKELKYKGNTLYLSTQICARLKTSRSVLALLSILTLSTFMLVSMGLKFNEAGKDSNKLFPFDIQAEQVDNGEIALDTSSITTYLDQHKISYKGYRYAHYRMDFNAKSIVKDIKWKDVYKHNSDFLYIKYSDYQMLMKMLGTTPKSLAQNQYMIATQNDFKDSVNTNAKTHSFAGLSYAGYETREFGESEFNAIIFIVPDKTIEQYGKHGNDRYVVKTKTPSTIAWSVAIEDKFYKHNSLEVKDKNGETKYLSSNLMVRAEWVSANLTSVVVIVFTLIYVAIILSCVSATVLAIQQMSDVWKQKKSYVMLWKMGLDKKEIYALLRKQIAVYFFVPFIIPVAFIFPLVYISDQLFELSYSRGSLVPLATISILFYLVIYSIYYLLAYFNCKHSLDM